MLYALVGVRYLVGGLDEPGRLQGGADLLPAVVEAYLRDPEEDLLVLHREGRGTGGDGHQAGVHLGLRFEPGFGNVLDYLALCLVEQVDGESRIVGAAHVGDHALGELLLHHDHRLLEGVFEKLEDDGGGDAVRQVADEPVERGEGDLHGIPVDEGELISVGLLDVLGEATFSFGHSDIQGFRKSAGLS